MAFVAMVACSSSCAKVIMTPAAVWTKVNNNSRSEGKHIAYEFWLETIFFEAWALTRLASRVAGDSRGVLCSKASSLKSDFSSRPVRHPKVIVAAFHFERIYTYNLLYIYCCSIHTIKHALAKRNKSWYFLDGCSLRGSDMATRTWLL